MKTIDQLIDWGSRCLVEGYEIHLSVAGEVICRQHDAEVWAHGTGVDLDDNYRNYVKAILEYDNADYSSDIDLVSADEVKHHFCKEIREDPDIVYYRINHTPGFNQECFDIIVATWD